MTVKDRVIKLIDSLPDTPESERWLKSIAKDLSSTDSSNGAVEPVDEEEQIPTLEESIAILASVEFPPREEAWL